MEEFYIYNELKKLGVRVFVVCLYLYIGNIDSKIYSRYIVCYWKLGSGYFWGARL